MLLLILMLKVISFIQNGKMINSMAFQVLCTLWQPSGANQSSERVFAMAHITPAHVSWWSLVVSGWHHAKPTQWLHWPATLGALGNQAGHFYICVTGNGIAVVLMRYLDVDNKYVALWDFYLLFYFIYLNVLLKYLCLQSVKWMWTCWKIYDCYKNDLPDVWTNQHAMWEVKGDRKWGERENNSHEKRSRIWCLFYQGISAKYEVGNALISVLTF